MTSHETNKEDPSNPPIAIITSRHMYDLTPFPSPCRECLAQGILWNLSLFFTCRLHKPLMAFGSQEHSPKIYYSHLFSINPLQTFANII